MRGEKNYYFAACQNKTQGKAWCKKIHEPKKHTTKYDFGRVLYLYHVHTIKRFFTVYLIESTGQSAGFRQCWVAQSSVGQCRVILIREEIKIKDGETESKSSAAYRNSHQSTTLLLFTAMSHQMIGESESSAACRVRSQQTHGCFSNAIDGWRRQKVGRFAGRHHQSRISTCMKKLLYPIAD